MNLQEIISKKKETIALKKLSFKKSDAIANKIIKDLSDGVIKSMKPNSMDKEESPLNTAVVKAIANTYYWLDSHGDVHVKGCFTKSINENKNIFHLDNHNHCFLAVVGEIESLKEVSVKWSDLGIEKEGNTICLVFESEISDEYNEQAFDWYMKGSIYNHSVGMQYVNLQLAIKDTAQGTVDEVNLWNEIYPLLGNPQVADEDGYFWVVKEAKLKEVSCLLWDGSNTLTPTIEINVDTEPSEDTQRDEDKKEPINITQKNEEESTNEVAFKFNPNLY